MDEKLLKIIIILLLIIILIGIIYYAYERLMRKIRYWLMMLFGTTNLGDGIRKMEAEVANTPRTVSSATNLYLPMITKDFPEFHFDEMKTRAENVLISYLRSVDGENAALLTEGTNELKTSLLMRIQMLKQEGKKEHFQNIKIHNTQIYQYRKVKARCSVVFQSAIEYYHFVEQDGKVIKGRNDMLEQDKYNVEVVYIQDRETVENLGDSGLALNCPNCGAPLPALGAKKCAYCDTPVMEFNIRTWNFSSVKEAK